MSYEVIRLRAGDFDEAMDLLNLVFSQAGRPHDFARMFPRLMRPTDEQMQHLFACRREGRLRAIIGAFPMDAVCAGRKLRITGIGGVSTHSAERGNGLMRMLMERIAQEMKQDGTHLSTLGGYRLRYNRYGYEKAGQKLTYSLTVRNVRENHLDVPAADLHFEKIGPEDTAGLCAARALYEQQPFHIDRGGDHELYLHLTQWDVWPWAALDKDGKMVGYVTATQDGLVKDHFAQDAQSLLHMLSAWVLQHRPDGLEVELNPWELEEARLFGRVAEYVRTSFVYMYNVLDWVRVLDACLALRAAMSPIPDGELVIEIEGEGRFLLRVQGKDTACVSTERAADIALGRHDATRFLFGPLAPYATAPIPQSIAAQAAWFPLPISWHRQDNV